MSRKSQTTTGPVFALHSVNATDDYARVYVGGVDAVTRDLMPQVRKVAGAALHTIVGAPLRMVPGDGGVYVDVPAIRRRKVSESDLPVGLDQRSPSPAVPVVPTGAEADASEAVRKVRKLLGKVTLSDIADAMSAEQRARMAEILGVRTATAAPRTAGGPAGKRAERKAAHACKVCADLGMVRKAPRDNGSRAYITRKGMEASVALGNATPCEERGCKAGKAARKAA